MKTNFIYMVLILTPANFQHGLLLLLNKLLFLHYFNDKPVSFLKNLKQVLFYCIPTLSSNCYKIPIWRNYIKAIRSLGNITNYTNPFNSFNFFKI